MSDREINKLLIVIQAPPNRAQKHDRTGDWTTRAKMSQELVKAINDGLYYYEYDLWGSNDYVRVLKSAQNPHLFSFLSGETRE